MKRWLVRGLRSVVVLAGIIFLTSFTIDATDMLNGSQSAMSIFAKRVAETGCPANMIQVDMADRSICIDTFENSLSAECSVQRPSSAVDNQQNVNNAACTTVSNPDAVPLVFVTFHQAQNFCARRGGRLPTAYEWYDAALGTPDGSDCNLNGGLAPAGSKPECRSARGVYDMIGNAWEWVDAEVNDGIYAEQTLPPTGYVAEADRAGIALKTQPVSSDLFNKDYFWSAATGKMMMMRGGFYGSGTDGGIYSVHADVEPNFTSAAIGFRCVTNL